MKYFIFILSPLLICLTSGAQPVLSAINSNPVIGDIFYNHLCNTTGVSVTLTGPDVIWDYTNLKVNDQDTVNVVACNSTPYCDTFISSDFVEQTSPSNEFNYITANADQQSIIGEHNIYEAYVHFTRPSNFLKYPLTYPGNWNDTVTYHDTTSYFTDSSIYIVDGYGTLALPKGTLFNVLRLHHMMYITKYDKYFSKVFYVRSDYYLWYMPGFHYAVLSIATDNDTTTGAIKNIDLVEYATGSSLHYSPPLSIVNNSTDDVWVFPNPAKDVLHISGANIKGVELMDMTGKMLTSVDGCGSITLRTSTVANGIYLLKVKTDNGAVMKKIVIGQ